MADDPKPTPPAAVGTWEESVERRLSFVEELVNAGHAVGQRPGTAPSPPAPMEPLASAKDAAKNPDAFTKPAPPLNTPPLKKP